MEIELLRTFLEVARVRHFGRAAEALHLTQGAVSARIRKLEAALGVSLFDRQRRDVQLTPEGHRFVSHADRLISQWRSARQDVSVGEAAMQLSVGGSLRLWDVYLQDWLIRLHQAYPDWAISAESQSPDLLTRKVLDGVVDVAFMLEPAQIETLQIRAVAELELILVTTRRRASLDDALGPGYVMVDWGLAHALRHRRLYPDIPEPAVRLGQAGAALRFLEAVGGSAYLPKALVEERVQCRALTHVRRAQVFRYPIYAVYPLRGTRSNIVEQILDTLG